MRFWLLVVFFALLTAGCPARKDVPCSEDGSCDLSPGGACLAGPSSNAWCAYPDSSCPSGFRYSDFDVGDGVSGKCVGAPACSTEANCEPSAPICDATTRSCRGCRDDSECSSTVCDLDAETCVADSGIAYAMAGGSETSECQRAQPCSISQAIAVAKQQGKIVRLLPGVYATPIEVGTSNVTPLLIVASGATLTSFTGVAVGKGANVIIRGLQTTGANFALQCGDANMPRSRITFVDGALIAATSSSNLVSVSNCEVKMRNVQFRINDSTGTSLALSSDSSFDGDRLHFFGQQQTSIGTFGQRVSLRLTNSVLENPLILFATSDSSPGSSVNFAFNTIVIKDVPIGCSANSGSANRQTLFENNIIVGFGQTEVVEGTTCTLSNNILLPQPNAPAGNIVADPQFVDVTMRDYRVKSSSPAVGAALLAPMIFTDHDFEGRARPTGGAADIGAFEQ